MREVWEQAREGGQDIRSPEVGDDEQGSSLTPNWY